MTKKLFTFGYEGISIERFVERLLAAKISCVVDVRAVPISRKKGFSKTAFSKILGESGIEYCHYVAVGCPKDIRDRYRSNGNWSQYAKAYLTYLAGQQDCVREIAVRGEKQACCLVCFETDFNSCHRTFVARDVAKASKLSVFHLTDQKVMPDSVQLLAA